MVSQSRGPSFVLPLAALFVVSACFSSAGSTDASLVADASESRSDAEVAGADAAVSRLDADSIGADADASSLQGDTPIVDVCVPNAVRCEAGVLYTCNAVGSSEAATPCADGLSCASASACTLRCILDVSRFDDGCVYAP